jgi:adenylate cyclase class 2
MPLEIEVKCPLRDPRAFRARLQKAGARFVRRLHEKNLVLDTPRRALARSGRLLRVRLLRELKECHVAFKGPRLPGRAKRREEFNVDALPPAAVLGLFARLGYRPVWTYEKVREDYELRGAAVSVDRVARLGWFCEIEAPSERAVFALAKRLGLPRGELSSRSYGELGREKFGARPPDLAF